MDGQFWDIISDHGLEDCINDIRSKYAEQKGIRVKIETGLRTHQQNNALQLYCRLLAEALNDAGYDMKKTLAKSASPDIPWTQDLVREIIWKRIQKATIGKSSTTLAKTNEYDKVYDVVNRFTATRFGISIPFPSRSNNDDYSDIRENS